MGKDFFLKYFQNNLRVEICKLLKSWEFTDLNLVPEHGKLEGIFNGYIDIAIFNEKNQKSTLAIEIEHLSSYEQALQNIKKLKTWSHNSIYRKCAMLHMFNEDSNITEDL